MIILDAILYRFKEKEMNQKMTKGKGLFLGSVGLVLVIKKFRKVFFV